MELHSKFLEGFLKSWGVIMASEIGACNLAAWVIVWM